MSISGAHFDREQSLTELLPGKEAEKLVASLSVLFDCPVAVLDANGELLAGVHGLAPDCGVPLAMELEPIGSLRIAQASPVARQAAAALARQLLMARARYRMASGAHLASVQADYEELQRRHQALQTSEEKLRQLAAELEARVAAQVRVIDERQRQLYQAERLASVGQLAAGVAHEINNPIGFVRSNLSTAQKYVNQLAALAPRLKAGDAAAWQEADLDFVVADFADLLHDSIDGVDRVARIVADLKGFSNVDRPEEEVVTLRDVLDGACNMVATKLPPTVTLTRTYADLPPILCLPGHLAQAFLALLNNAVQALEDRLDGGRIEVSTMAGEGGQLVVVADNGVGIPAENLSRVFDPFYTTRPVGQGTGLGLSVARDIVQAHGGSIDLDSTPGVGTRAIVRLSD